MQSVMDVPPGINLETETSYYLTLAKKSDFTQPKLDKLADKYSLIDCDVNPRGMKIKKGKSLQDSAGLSYLTLV